MQPRQWLLACGHTAPMLEHERPDVLPSRPRMCERCGRLRDVEAPAVSGAGELVCVECGATSEDGRGWKAEPAPDLLEGVHEPETAIYCGGCWDREFQRELGAGRAAGADRLGA